MTDEDFDLYEEMASSMVKTDRALNMKRERARIEELELEVETWKSRALHQNEVVGRLEAKLSESEALLAKAVRFIKLSIELGRWGLNPSFRDEMIDFTTELTGGSK